ncbi:MAG: metallophosphoesterase [Bacteroidetes bacterium HGW-Bacteroidetes-14]|jgi:outer membrane protein assembly factor BamB|nr:MAG: metallophosphoesterase [Bacteroidetes bacterium HGW-Bacteroidetes-14]
MKAFKVLALFCLLFLYSADSQAQKKMAVRFAFLTDLHISDVLTNAEDLELSVEDLNSISNLSFVIFGGDITEFGSDEEISRAHAIISKLKVPWYIVGGNHDSKWSESGCNTFKDVFGYEWFDIEAGGIRILGCNSGPNMRMAPALVPRDAVLWLDSLTRSIPPATPVVFINHYPLDDAMLNYTTILDYLSRVNVQFAMCGHGHNNRTFSYKVPGSPNTAVTPVIRGVMGRSNLRAGKGSNGYNIIDIDQTTGNITFTERSGGKTLAPWHTLKMLTPPPAIKTTTLFNYQDDSDIGSGAVIDGNRIFWANANGVIKAFDVPSSSASPAELKNLHPAWTFKTGGKIFSTPAIAGGSLVVGSSDTHIYNLDIKSGKLIWKYKATKSVLASPTIHNGVVYIGASDGIFRAIDLKTGKLVWEFKDVKGFVESKAWVDDSGVYFGTWGSMLYALSPKDGSLLWNWTNHKGRGLSPAAVWPVKANGKIFVATPERMTHAIDGTSGTELWRARGGRESVGLSPDATILYIKTMQDTVFAYRTDVNFTTTATPAASSVTQASPSSAAQTLVPLTDKSLRKWTSHTGYGYEIAPSAITSAYGYVFIPTDKGNIFVLNEADGSVAGIIRFSGALINHILPTGNRQILVSSMDGRVALLKLE